MYRLVFITRDLPGEEIERTLAAFEGAVEEGSSYESPHREQEAAGMVAGCPEEAVTSCPLAKR